jgi:hypothetical protein
MTYSGAIYLPFYLNLFFTWHPLFPRIVPPLWLKLPVNGSLFFTAYPSYHSGATFHNFLYGTVLELHPQSHNDWTTTQHSNSFFWVFLPSTQSRPHSHWWVDNSDGIWHPCSKSSLICEWEEGQGPRVLEDLGKSWEAQDKENTWVFPG